MHLVAPLMTGVRGAKNGSVSAYERGTETPAPVYADASGKVRRYGALRLDALGSMALYVDRLVDVMVRDADGALVRAWTDGRSAGAVVVESPAFTGVDYETGVSGVGERTTLVEALGRWTGGALDFNVTPLETAMPVYVAIGNAVGVFFDPTAFGAIGDGTGDDWGSIQAAIESARKAGGGVVYLRAGTYLVSGALNLYNNVSLVGANATSTHVVMTSSADPLMYVFGSDNPDEQPFTPSHHVSGIHFRANVLTAQPLIHLVSGNASINACRFEGASNTGHLVAVDALEGCRIGDSTFEIASPTTSAIYASGAVTALGAYVKRVYVDNCVFRTVASGHTSAVGLVGVSRLHMEGCQFDLLGAVGTTASCLRLEGEMHAAVDGCDMLQDSSAFPTLLRISDLSSVNDRVFEDCSLIHNGMNSFLYGITYNDSAPIHYCRLSTADCRHAPIAQDTVALSADLFHLAASDASQYGVFSSYNTTASALVAPDSGMVAGAFNETQYRANIPLGRTVDFLYFVTNPEAFTYAAGVSRMSAVGTWLMKAASLHAFRTITTRILSQTPAVVEVTKMCLLTRGDEQSTADLTAPSGYGPI